MYGSIFTNIYHKNQPFMSIHVGKHTSRMNPMGHMHTHDYQYNKVASEAFQVASLMISQLYVWRLDDFLRAWYLLREPLVMQVSSEMAQWQTGGRWVQVYTSLIQVSLLFIFQHCCIVWVA